MNAVGQVKGILFTAILWVIFPFLKRYIVYTILNIRLYSLHEEHQNINSNLVSILIMLMFLGKLFNICVVKDSELWLFFKFFPSPFSKLWTFTQIKSLAVSMFFHVVFFCRGRFTWASIRCPSSSFFLFAREPSSQPDHWQTSSVGPCPGNQIWAAEAECTRLNH